MSGIISAVARRALMLLAAFSLSAVAQQPYPSKSIRFLVGYSPGGVNDIVSRILSPEMSVGLGQQVVVDNRAGAAGIIANNLAAQAAADGHTILLVPSSFATDMARGVKLPYDPVRDFLPVTLVASSSLVLVVNPQLPATSVRELIALAKSKPGQLAFGHAGNGNITHITAEMLVAMTGISVVAVAYKGGGAALIDVMSGQVQFGTPTIPPALGFLKAGRLRALGVTGSKRTPILPDVPTIAEAGVPGYESSAWWGVLVPRGTPPAIVERLNREIVRVLGMDETRERLAALGADTVGSSPKELGDFLRAETARWKDVITKAKIKID